MALQAEKKNISTLTFADAAKFWKLRRAQSKRLKARTHETTAENLRALEKFFSKVRLCDITPGNIRAYQLARLDNLIRTSGEDLHPWSHYAGHSRINHEVSTLGQMLRHCRLWQRIKPFYFPLSIPSWSPREIFTDEEEEQFFRVAAQHPEAELAYWIATITANTTAAGCELRGLRLRHVFLRPTPEISEIYIPEDAVKNDSRPRKIALNSVAKWAVQQCYKRALKLGCADPDHYLFPGRIKRNHYDPLQPPSRWFLRNSWNQLRAATGHSELKPHDLRFLCITKLLEEGVHPETVRSLAGHVTQKMVEYYAKHRRKAKYAAVRVLEPKKKKSPKSEPAKRQRKQA